jgi:polyphosphate kinase
VSPRPVAPDELLNRELSWLEFNARVLHEAFDERNPLLERLKFLAIFATNLDEFYMVRVAGLRRQLAAGVSAPAADGLTPQAQLAAIEEGVRELLAQQRRCLHDLLLPALAREDIRLVRMEELAPEEWSLLDDFFEAQVFPVLTPLAVDPGHPFPYISNLSLSLAVCVRDPAEGEEHFARVKVPKSLPRWVAFGRERQFVPLEQVIGANLPSLFPGMEVLSWHAFRLTRYNDLELSNLDDSEDLLASVEKQVFERRFGEVVRVEVQDGMPPALSALLLEELRDESGPEALPLTERDLQTAGPLLELGDLMTIAQLDVPALRDPPLTPRTPPELRDPTRSIFNVMRERDILVHHPFDSFAASVEEFLTAAARDDLVVAIKLTLYRTSGDTAIVRALTEAAQRGKQVAVLVELQARFDEAANIGWARTLEDYGVHVAYGLEGLKTHSKTALVVRRDPDGLLRRYVHVGTGNYNSKTARLYTDIGLLTVRSPIAADLSDLFNLLTGFSRQRSYRRLLVAPANMRARFLELIAREIAHARAGRPAYVVAKMNAIVDPELIGAVYEASRAGVAVDLVVRGICCLRPGVPGLSERVRVVSIVGRFLEHSRIFYFHNDGDPEYFIGSADWMPRNLDRRVEAIAPVEDHRLQRRLRSLLAVCLNDNRQAWDLMPDGEYVQRQPGPETARATHVILLADPWGGEAEGEGESPYREAESGPRTLEVPRASEPRAEHDGEAILAAARAVLRPRRARR